MTRCPRSGSLAPTALPQDIAPGRASVSGSAGDKRRLSLFSLQAIHEDKEKNEDDSARHDDQRPRASHRDAGIRTMGKRR